MAEDAFLTTDEVLRYLQVNLRTIYRLIKSEKIPAVRVGRQWRFRKRDIDACSRVSARAARASLQRRRGPCRHVPPPARLVVDDEAAIRDLLAKTLALADATSTSHPMDGRRSSGCERCPTISLLLI